MNSDPEIYIKVIMDMFNLYSEVLTHVYAFVNLAISQNKSSQSMQNILTNL